jgi:hypothetical protein
VLGGVILGNHESTHPEEYAAQAQRGIYKRITHDKAVFAVVDGVGPLANALSADSRFAPQVSRALMHLVNTLKDAVMVSAHPAVTAPFQPLRLCHNLLPVTCGAPSRELCTCLLQSTAFVALSRFTPHACRCSLRLQRPVMFTQYLTNMVLPDVYKPAGR